MCHFITNTYQGKLELNKLNEIAKNYNLGFSICENEYVKTQLNQKDIYLEKVAKYCDCGTAIGISSSNQIQTNRISKEEIVKLKNKGWSKSKIERWKFDKLKSVAKTNAKNQFIADGNYIELESWNNFIHELLNLNNVNKFGIILHWYSRNIETERVKVKNIMRIKLKDVSPSVFKTMEEDVLYEIVK